MPLPNHVIKIVSDLMLNEDFIELWKHFRKQAELLSQEILDPGTDEVERSRLVRAYSVLKTEVVDLPEMVIRQINKQTAGQATGPG